MFSPLRLMQRWLRNLRSTPQVRNSQPARLQLEVLEDRQLLSAALLVQTDGANAKTAAVLAALPGLERPEATHVTGMYRLSGDAAYLNSLAPRLERLAGVSYVELEQTVSVALTPNDPKFTDNTLWGLNGTNGINAPTAWNTNTGSSKVVVGIIDTGIDYKHPDLYLNVWINQEEIPSSVRSAIQADANWDVDSDGLITFWDLNASQNQGTGKITDTDNDGRITGADIIKATSAGGWDDNTDADSNGFSDDLIGWDFVNSDNNPLDDNNHGTHVAGTIGAIGNNSNGVVGVNWKVQMAALKFLNASGSGGTSGAIAAVNYARNEGMELTNNSWGGGGFSSGLSNAISQARTAGQLFIAAAGNSGISNDSTAFYPASYNFDNVIAVASTTSTGALSSFSNYGATTVDVGAPGSSILSTTPSNTYSTFNGTSMATPHVAGLAALMWANYPSFTYSQIRDLMFDTTRPLSSLSGKTVTGGIIDAGLAVKNGPEIQVLNGSTLLRDNTATIGFGATLAGTPVLKTFTIKNLGNQTLNIGTIATPTGFSVSTPPGSSALTTGQSTTFTVSLTALASGVFSGNVIINTNDGDEGSYEIAVSGTVTGAPPVLTQPVEQTMPTTQDTLNVTLVATDPDGPFPLTFSATVESQAQQLDQQHGFFSNGDLFVNWGGLGEKWFQGSGNNWYFIKPNGDLLRWNNSPQSALTGTFIVNVETVYHTTPSLLYNATLAATVSTASNVLTVNPNSGFIGKLFVTATVSDGQSTNSKTFTINVTAAASNQPPILTPPGNESMPTSQDTLAVTLSATDPNGDPITFSATVQSEAYKLDQQYGFFTDGNLWTNYGGENEKWFLASGNVWHFIKPNGEVYQWSGVANQASGTLKFTLETVYHTDPSKLFNATQGGSVSVAGNVVTVNPDAGFIGKLFVTATASDGQASDSETFTVTVTA